MEKWSKQLITSCYRYGRILYKVCQSYAHADQELRERVEIVQGVSLKTRRQAEDLRGIWYTLDSEIQTHQNSALAILNTKLNIAVDIIVGLDDGDSKKSITTSKDGHKKVKYAVYGKRRLETIIKELEEWQTRFDPSWYLLASIVSSIPEQVSSLSGPEKSSERAIVQDLREAHRLNEKGSNESVFLSQTFVDDDQLREILYTSAYVGKAATGNVVVDTVPLAVGNENSALDGARNLARILAHVRPEIFGLLSCVGVLKLYAPSNRSDNNPGPCTAVRFVFNFPPQVETLPRSLREVLFQSMNTLPLDDRVRIAKLLGRSVSYLHSAKIIHKNVSPETILLFRNSQSQLESPFLVGFQKFRRDDEKTQKSGDMLWYKNIYRHPARQGQHPDNEYRMQHDIYSLGVCMLEIGLGYSFVKYIGTSITPNPQLGIEDDLRNKDERQRSRSIKAKLIQTASELLPARMGRAYTSVVHSCLTCLDADNQDFGDPKEFEDEDGILVGVRYIEKVCQVYYSSDWARLIKKADPLPPRGYQAVRRFAHETMNMPFMFTSTVSMGHSKGHKRNTTNASPYM